MTDPYAPSTNAGDGRAWVVPVVVGLAAVAAFLGFWWGHSDATAHGLDEDGVRAAALVVGGAAAVGAFGVGNIAALLLARAPGRRISAGVTFGLSVALIVVAAVLVLVLYPAMLER